MTRLPSKATGFRNALDLHGRERPLVRRVHRRKKTLRDHRRGRC